MKAPAKRNPLKRNRLKRNPLKRNRLTRVVSVNDMSNGPIENTEFQEIDFRGNKIFVSFFVQRCGEQLTAEAVVKTEPNSKVLLKFQIFVIEDDPVPCDLLVQRGIPWLLGELGLDEDKE